MTNGRKPQEDLHKAVSAMQRSIGDEISDMMSGKLPADPLTDCYDLQGKALSSAASLQPSLQTSDVQLILAIAKHRKRERGDKQGYSPLTSVSETTGFAVPAISKRLAQLEEIDLVTIARDGQWVRLLDAGLKIVSDVMAPWTEILRLKEDIASLRKVLNAFRIDADKACAMLGSMDEVWLGRAGLYGAALMQSFGKLSPDMLHEESGDLMRLWLIWLPGINSPDSSKAREQQTYVNDWVLQPLLKDP